MKLLCLHVSEHRDEAIVRPIWNDIFEESEPRPVQSGINAER